VSARPATFDAVRVEESINRPIFIRIHGPSDPNYRLP
jgi:hypothetical protein